MSLNWSTVKSLAIPVGGTARDVKRVSIGGAVVWEKNASPLPPGARWVEYLESTGTQYLNTGVDAAVGLTIDTTFAYTAQTSYGILFGVQSPANNFLEVRLNGNYATLTALVRNAVTTMAAITFNEVNRFVGEWTSTGADLDLNGTTYTSTAGAVAGSSNYPLYIFAGNQANAAAYHSKARVYSFKITDAQGVLVRDFRPIAIGTTGYMLDMVSGQYLPYGNAGTGDFVLGPDVVPVEYIESHGTEWIDTGYAMADIRQLDLRVDCRDHSTDRRDIMGGAASGSYLIEVSAAGYFGVSSLAYSSFRPSGIDDLSWRYTVGVAPSLYVNGAFGCADTLVRVPSGTFKTAINANYVPKCKLYGIKAWTDNNLLVRGMTPVRVGSGSTWEGAMIDTLTRRIYRNQGTGAFGYGADLPQ